MFQMMHNFENDNIITTILIFTQQSVKLFQIYEYSDKKLSELFLNLHVI